MSEVPMYSAVARRGGELPCERKITITRKVTITRKETITRKVTATRKHIRKTPEREARDARNHLSFKWPWVLLVP